MMMYITWLIELYASIKMLEWWVWCNNYMRCMSVCQSIQFLYDSSISCPNNTIMVLVFLINILFHWSPFFTDHMFIIFFTSSKIIVQFCVWCWEFRCWVAYDWSIVYVGIVVAHSWFFSSWVKMLSNGYVLICLCSWFQQHYSFQICVGFVCCVFHMTNLHVFVMWIGYDLSWWFWSLSPSIVPWVHGPPSSCWTTTVDPMGIET